MCIKLNLGVRDLEQRGHRLQAVEKSGGGRTSEKKLISHIQKKNKHSLF